MTGHPHTDQQDKSKAGHICRVSGLISSLKAAPVYPHFGFLPLPFFAPPPHGVGCKKGAFSFGNYGLSEKRKQRVSNRFAVETLTCRGHHSATLRGFPWALSGLRPRSTHAQKGRRLCAITARITGGMSAPNRYLSYCKRARNGYLLSSPERP